MSELLSYEEDYELDDASELLNYPEREDDSEEEPNSEDGERVSEAANDNTFEITLENQYSPEAIHIAQNKVMELFGGTPEDWTLNREHPGNTGQFTEDGTDIIDTEGKSMLETVTSYWADKDPSKIEQFKQEIATMYKNRGEFIPNDYTDEKGNYHTGFTFADSMGRVYQYAFDNTPQDKKEENTYTPEFGTDWVDLNEPDFISEGVPEVHVYESPAFFAPELDYSESASASDTLQEVNIMSDILSEDKLEENLEETQTRSVLQDQALEASLVELFSVPNAAKSEVVPMGSIADTLVREYERSHDKAASEIQIPFERKSISRSEVNQSEVVTNPELIFIAETKDVEPSQVSKSVPKDARAEVMGNLEQEIEQKLVAEIAAAAFKESEVLRQQLEEVAVIEKQQTVILERVAVEQRTESESVKGERKEASAPEASTLDSKIESLPKQVSINIELDAAKEISNTNLQETIPVNEVTLERGSTRIFGVPVEYLYTRKFVPRERPITIDQIAARRSPSFVGVGGDDSEAANDNRPLVTSRNGITMRIAA